jgi:peptidoglycan/xylan/chitin deacetylase (PgdA/CDA1 family)
MTGALLRVLMYHRVVDPRDAIGSNPSVISATPETFAEQMRHVARYYRVVSADQVLETVRYGRPLPKHAVLITFDDAYRDFGEIAWPILRRLRLPATVFVPTAYPGDARRAFWWDRLASAIAHASRTAVESLASGMLSRRTSQGRGNSLRALRIALKQRPHEEAMRIVDELCATLGESQAPESAVLSWDQLRELNRDGVTVAAHTQNHPSLTKLPLEQARGEVHGSRADLIRELGTAPGIFSYPFGEHSDSVVELVRDAGFDIAVTCLSGYSNVQSADPLRLRRINITMRTTPFLFPMRLLRYGCDLDRLRQTAREWLAVPRRARLGALRLI